MIKAINFTEEGVSKIKDVLRSYNQENDINHFSAFMFPVNSKLYDKLSYPVGHSPIDSKNIEQNEEVFNQFTPDIRNYFLENDFNITVVRDRSKKVRYEVLQNADIILPVITFIGKASFAIGTGVLARYIYEKYMSSSNKSNSTIEADVVHLETENMNFKRYKISGSAPEVVEALKVLSNDNEVKANGDGLQR